MTLPAATRGFLDQPALRRLWDAVARRLERNGLTARGRLRLPGADDGEREALGLLMGRPYPGPAEVTIDLADLDTRLRAGAADGGLVDVTVALRGPLHDRRAARDAWQASAAQVWTAARDALRATGLDGVDWAEPWLAEVRRGGALTRLDPVRAIELVRQAGQVLGELAHAPAPMPIPGDQSHRPGTAAPAGDRGHVGRSELAERVTGSVHGLDDDTLLARLVLRALALARGEDPPRDAPARRALWEAAGVGTDGVSSTVLTYGLAPISEDWPARLLRERAARWVETHLTA